MGDHGTCLFTLLDPRQPRCHLVLKKDKFNFFDGREHYLIEMCFIHLLYKLYYSIDYISSHVFAKKNDNIDSSSLFPRLRLGRQAAKNEINKPKPFELGLQARDRQAHRIVGRTGTDVMIF
jgi:hypothetical protein